MVQINAAQLRQEISASRPVAGVEKLHKDLWLKIIQNQKEHRTLPPPCNGNPTRALVGATVGFTVGFGAVSLFGPAAGQFKSALGLSPLAVSWLISSPALSGSLLRIPFSAWVDTTGGRTPFLVLLGMSILGLLGLLLVLAKLDDLHDTPQLYPILLALGVMSGSGIASFSVGISQVSYWYPQEGQGRALAAYAGFGNLGPGLISFVLPTVIQSFGLFDTYLMWLALLLIGTTVYYAAGSNAWYFQLLRTTDSSKARTFAQEYGQELFPRGSALEGLKSAAGVWNTWILVVVYFTTFGGFLALTSWLPTYWKELHGLDEKAAGMLAGAFSLLASLIRVPGGSISDRFGGERTLLASLYLVAAAAALLTCSEDYTLDLVGQAGLAIGMGISNAAVFKLVPQEVPQAVGGAAGWVGGLGAFGGFVMPPMMASFVAHSGTSGYSQGFSIIALMAVASIVASFVMTYTGTCSRSASMFARQTSASIQDYYGLIP